MTQLFADHRSSGCPSNYLLDRWRLGELRGACDEVATHVSRCSACRHHLDAEASAFATIERAQTEVVAAILSGSQRDGQASADTRYVRARSRAWWIPALAAASVAALVLALVPLDLMRRPEERSKGGAPLALAVFRDRDGEVVRVFDGGLVAAGDRLRFEVRAPVYSELMIVGVEASGRLFAYHPLDGSDRSVLCSKGGTWLLPGAVKLDDSMGREMVTLVACPRAFALRELSATQLPEGCERRSIALVKERR